MLTVIAMTVLVPNSTGRIHLSLAAAVHALTSLLDGEGVPHRKRSRPSGTLSSLEVLQHLS